MSLTNASSWAPTGETSTEILDDSVNLMASAVLSGVGYGVALTLFLICSHVLILKYKAECRLYTLLSLLYIFFMFFCGTVITAVNARESQLGYVNNRNFPGGPFAYTAFLYDLPISIVGSVSYFVINWMNDALLVWRLSILYNGTFVSKWVVAFACILYLANFATGLATLVEISLPTRSLWASIASRFVLGYYSIAVAFPIIMTALMVSRIILARHEVNKYASDGLEPYNVEYLGVAAMLVESAALYTIWSIIFLGLYAAENPIQYVFLATLPHMQIISPLLIIFRVSQGKAWSVSTTNMITTLKFKKQMHRRTFETSDFTRSAAVEDLESASKAGQIMDINDPECIGSDSTVEIVPEEHLRPQ